jgi:hypothetical protein
MRAILLILVCSLSVLADGINKPKPKPKRKVHKVQQTKVVKVETPKVAPVKPMGLLATKYDELLGYPYLRPLQAPLDVPPLTPELITTSQMAVYPFEESRRPKLWFLLIGTAAIPFLIPHSEDSPTPIDLVPTPQSGPLTINPVTAPTPTTPVPEPTSIVLFITGLAIILKRKVIGHLIKTGRQRVISFMPLLGASRRKRLT